jgi:succinate dehydrogenase/fumarate reductase cytochrome b subunit
MGFASALFSHWLVQIILLVFGLFHALNGLRITLVDLFPKLNEQYRTSLYIQWIVYIALAGYVLSIILRNAFGA